MIWNAQADLVIRNMHINKGLIECAGGHQHKLALPPAVLIKISSNMFRTSSLTKNKDMETQNIEKSDSLA